MERLSSRFGDLAIFQSIRIKFSEESIFIHTESGNEKIYLKIFYFHVD
mgnify:CR=1 FL=1|jgi:hypothetical protein